MNTPTSPSERFPFLDILRGFALLGVIVANMATHSGYFFLSAPQRQAFDTANADGIVAWSIHFLIEGKFYSLFALLFGIGFALQMQRFQQSQTSFESRFARRLMVLLIFGVLHAVLFYVGDILTVYALTGFVLMLFRKAPEKALLKASLILLLLPFLQYSILLARELYGSTGITTGPEPDQGAFFDQLVYTYRTGSFADIVKNNIGGLIFGRYPDLIFSGRFFKVLAMFLIGAYIARTFNFNRLSDHHALLRKVLFVSACIGFPCNIVLAMMMETNAYYGMQPSGLIQPLVYAYGVPALALFFASGLALLYSQGKWRSVLNAFAPVGQLALTNYLMQSVICCLIFMSYGLGLFGTVGRVSLTLIAFAIFIMQMLFSHWWIRRFRFGPMEWIWRSLTYKKLQPMRRLPTALVAPGD